MNLPLSNSQTQKIIGHVEIDDMNFDALDMAIVPVLAHINGEWKITEFSLVQRTKVNIEHPGKIFSQLLTQSTSTKSER
jgi:hypothetical protein